MNKARKNRHEIKLMLAFMCLIFFNGCGLDVIYVIDPPGPVTHEPIYSSLSPDDPHFDFMTYEDTYSGIAFLGTEVYYKIYRSYSNMISESNTIINLASSIETSENAPRRLIDSYKYQPLKVAGYNESVLIPTENNNRSVYIRLNDDDPYEAEIKVDGNYMYESITKTIPVRNNAKHTSFNFSINNPDSIPKSDDDDVSYSGSGNDNTWYVCMFAVAVGHDVSYVQTYSNVLYLGSVTINVK